MPGEFLLQFLKVIGEDLLTGHMKNDLLSHNQSVEEAVKLAQNKLLWRLLEASGALH